MFPIPVFIGISQQFKCIEGLTKRSILINTNSPVTIEYIYPETESGCTGFTNVRYQIEYGIYLDCDMIVLGDIAELWSYRQKGKFTTLIDGSSEVAVIDCIHKCTNKYHEHLLPKRQCIPLKWNIEDTRSPGMKLLHFTNLKTQPWFYNHPDKKAVAIYEQYK